VRATYTKPVLMKHGLLRRITQVLSSTEGADPPRGHHSGQDDPGPGHHGHGHAYGLGKE